METATIKPTQTNTDFEVRSLGPIYIEQPVKESGLSYVKYLVMGIFFGIILVKSEVISWYRIQEMFRLQSFHMYGVIGSAVVTGMISIWIIKRFNIKTIKGEKIELPQKSSTKDKFTED